MLATGTAALPDPRARNHEGPTDTDAEPEIAVPNEQLVRVPRELRLPEPFGAKTEPQILKLVADERLVMYYPENRFFTKWIQCRIIV